MRHFWRSTSTFEILQKLNHAEEEIVWHHHLNFRHKSEQFCFQSEILQFLAIWSKQSWFSTFFPTKNEMGCKFCGTLARFHPNMHFTYSFPPFKSKHTYITPQQKVQFSLVKKPHTTSDRHMVMNIFHYVHPWTEITVSWWDQLSSYQYHTKKFVKE